MRTDHLNLRTTVSDSRDLFQEILHMVLSQTDRSTPATEPGLAHYNPEIEALAIDNREEAVYVLLVGGGRRSARFNWLQ